MISPYVANDRSISGNDGQIDRREGAVYFKSRTSKMAPFRFRVYDVALVGKALKRVAIESPAAVHRYFVQANGGRWRYSFVKGERRELSAPALERQLSAATYSNPDRTRGDPR